MPPVTPGGGFSRERSPLSNVAKTMGVSGQSSSRQLSARSRVAAPIAMTTSTGLSRYFAEKAMQILFVSLPPEPAQVEAFRVNRDMRFGIRVHGFAYPRKYLVVERPSRFGLVEN